MNQKNSTDYFYSVFSYTVIILSNGTVIYDGFDEGTAISKFDPPTKVFRKYKISQVQVKELLSEFNKIDFFSLNNNYNSRDNGDGTILMVYDGGISSVITTISINGKTKSVDNFLFAPTKLIELQRKIYRVCNISRFVKSPPYWMSVFPDDQFPPRSVLKRNKETLQSKENTPKIEYRKISRNSPKGRNDGHIDINKTWGFITPCVTTKEEVEKVLGSSIGKADYSEDIYKFKNVKLMIHYSDEKYDNQLCNNKLRNNTVLTFSVIPVKDTKFSELEIDLSQFKKYDKFRVNEVAYNNQHGIYIESEIVDFKDEAKVEMLSRIQFFQRK